MLAKVVIDHVARLGRRIVAQRKIDTAAVLFRLTPAERGVGLFGLSVVELPREFAVAVGIAGKHDQSGGFPVQSVHDARFGKAVLLQAGHQAVAVILGTAGNGEKQGGFVDHQQGSVLVDDLDIA